MSAQRGQVSRRSGRDPRGAKGRLGEGLAAAWLALQGWRVVARGSRVGGVQVDLVARRDHVDALVEVKTRGRAPPEAPESLLALVSRGQLRRLERAARAWAATHPRVVRVDVVEVRLTLPFPRFLRHEDVLRSAHLDTWER